MAQMNMAAPKQAHASNLIIEDHLSKILSKTDTKGWKSYDNPCLPRAQHSPFGDFPADYSLPKKESGAATKKADPAATQTKTVESKSNCSLRKPADCKWLLVV